MSLESLLKPVKFVDEQILRQYTKIAKKWEDKGRNIYALSLFFSFPGIMLITDSFDRQFGSLAGDLIYLFSYGFDNAQNILGFSGFLKENKISSEAISLNPAEEYTKKMNRMIRLPTFLSGVGLVGKSSYDFINYFVNGEPFDNTISHQLSLGLGLLCAASSQYIKDRNPKLLDKEPFWKKAYSSLKEKADSLMPKPMPDPIPVESYSTLENYIK